MAIINIVVPEQLVLICAKTEATTELVARTLTAPACQTGVLYMYNV